VSLLDGDIPRMQFGELLRTDSGGVMAIHVQGHDRSIRNRLIGRRANEATMPSHGGHLSLQ
jgi:hypothetical protein